VSLHYVVKCQCLKATLENKTSVTTHFNKLTTENNVFIVSVIVKSNSNILQFSHQIFNVELCADELVVDGGVGWSYHRRRRRGFMVGGGGVGGIRPDEKALKQRTR